VQCQCHWSVTVTVYSAVSMPLKRDSYSLQCSVNATEAWQYRCWIGRYWSSYRCIIMSAERLVQTTYCSNRSKFFRVELIVLLSLYANHVEPGSSIWQWWSLLEMRLFHVTLHCVITDGGLERSVAQQTFQSIYRKRLRCPMNLSCDSLAPMTMALSAVDGLLCYYYLECRISQFLSFWSTEIF